MGEKFKTRSGEEKNGIGLGGRKKFFPQPSLRWGSGWGAAGCIFFMRGLDFLKEEIIGIKKD